MTSLIQCGVRTPLSVDNNCVGCLCNMAVGLLFDREGYFFVDIEGHLHPISLINVVFWRR